MRTGNDMMYCCHLHTVQNAKKADMSCTPASSVGCAQSKRYHYALEQRSQIERPGPYPAGQA